MDPKTAAILFVDVSGSTAFFDRYGEVAGHAMVEHCFKVIVPFVETHGGRIVKYLGDGFLAVFDGPEAAVDAAAVMHSSLADDNATHPVRTKKAGRVTASDGLSEAQWATFAAGVELVASAVREQTDLRCVIHPHAAGFIETPDEVARLLDLTGTWFLHPTGL